MLEFYQERAGTGRGVAEECRGSGRSGDGFSLGREAERSCAIRERKLHRYRPNLKKKEEKKMEWK